MGFESTARKKQEAPIEEGLEDLTELAQEIPEESPELTAKKAASDSASKRQVAELKKKLGIGSEDWERRKANENALAGIKDLAEAARKSGEKEWRQKMEDDEAALGARASEAMKRAPLTPSMMAEKEISMAKSAGVYEFSDKRRAELQGRLDANVDRIEELDQEISILKGPIGFFKKMKLQAEKRKLQAENDALQQDLTQTFENFAALKRQEAEAVEAVENALGADDKKIYEAELKSVRNDLAPMEKWVKRDTERAASENKAERKYGSMTEEDERDMGDEARKTGRAERLRRG